MGSDPDELGVSTSLDRHRDLSSGREAAVGARRLPGAQRRGADPPRVSRQRSVQSLDALVATDPSAGLGSADADDHRRSLSCCESRDLGAHDRLGCGQAHKRAMVCHRYQGSPCLFLTLQNFSDYPLSSRLDENDAIIVFDQALIPWENVFVYEN